MDAKSAREQIRSEIVKAIIRDRRVTPEVDALLKADRLATENLQTVQTAYSQISDST